VTCALLRSAGVIADVWKVLCLLPEKPSRGHIIHLFHFTSGNNRADFVLANKRYVEGLCTICCVALCNGVCFWQPVACGDLLG
jgi:hypothetical protein